MNIKRKLYKIFRFVPKNDIELRKMGGEIGKNFHNYGYIDTCFTYLLKVGDNVTFAGNSRILFHDASLQKIFGVSKVGKVEIGNDVFIGANALILPNVKIGNKVIVGAGSLISKDIPDNSVVVGNPQRIICTYDDYVNKYENFINDENKFNQNEVVKIKNAAERGNFIFV
ncbi:MAG: acyltransferase [Treponema sp.]|nr:acyltransferase [Treponema sp.]